MSESAKTNARSQGQGRHFCKQPEPNLKLLPFSFAESLTAKVGDRLPVFFAQATARRAGSVAGVAATLLSACGPGPAASGVFVCEEPAKRDAGVVRSLAERAGPCLFDENIQWGIGVAHAFREVGCGEMTCRVEGMCEEVYKKLGRRCGRGTN